MFSPTLLSCSTASCVLCNRTEHSRGFLITRMRSNPRYKLGRIFFFFFVMVVANCNASCDWLYVRCSQWELLLFFHLDSSLHLSQYGRFHAVSFETASRDAQTLNLPRNVSKFNAQQVVSLMNEQQSQKLLFKVEPLSPTKTTSWSRKVKTVKNSKHQLS